VRGFVDIVGHGDVREPSPESEHYRDIRQPVWILRGSEDRDWMPAEHEARYRELMPDARLIRWNNVGHSPHIEAPERFASLVAEFLGATERKRRPRR
jgi:pimeloyl-ACP methyl ester carboxylesterase